MIGKQTLLVLFAVAVLLMGGCAAESDSGITSSWQLASSGPLQSEAPVSGSDSSEGMISSMPEEQSELYETVAKYAAITEDMEAVSDFDVKKLRDAVSSLEITNILVQTKWLNEYPIEKLSDKNIYIRNSSPEMLSDDTEAERKTKAILWTARLNNFTWSNPSDIWQVPYIDATDCGFERYFHEYSKKSSTELCHSLLYFADQITQLQKEWDVEPYSTKEILPFQIIRLSDTSFLFCNWAKENGQQILGEGSLYCKNDGDYQLRAVFSFINSFGIEASIETEILENGQ